MAPNIAAYITGQKDRDGEEFDDMVRSARVKTGCVTGDPSCSGKGKQIIRGDFDPADFDASGNYDGADKEMPMVGAIYSQDNFSVEAWNYYVNDFANTLYLYGKYNFTPSENWNLSVVAQYSNQQDVGDSVGGDVDTWL